MKTDTVIKNQWALSSFGIVREYDTHNAICEMRLIDKDRWSDTNPQWAQNAELIVTAVNACKEINPDNPLNAAKELPELINVFNVLLSANELNVGEVRTMQLKAIQLMKQATE